MLFSSMRHCGEVLWLWVQNRLPLEIDISYGVSTHLDFVILFGTFYLLEVNDWGYMLVSSPASDGEK